MFGKPKNLLINERATVRNLENQVNKVVLASRPKMDDS